MKSAKPEGLKIGSLEKLVLAMCLSSLDKKTPQKIRGKKKSGSAASAGMPES